LLSVADLSYAYGERQVLDGVSFDVPAGGAIGLLGPNGAGKTTLLHLLAGVSTPDAGRITLDGVPLAGLPRQVRARRIALVPQETHVTFDYSVREMVLMGRYPHLGPFEIEGPADLAMAGAALAATDAGGFADRRFATLSGGEKQRVVLASALAQLGVLPSSDAADGRRPEPALLLLDEPTTGLDLGHEVALMRLLTTLNTRFGLTLLVSTHHLAFAAACCTLLLVLKDGRLVARGTPREVLTPRVMRDVYGVEIEPPAGDGPSWALAAHAVPAWPGPTP
jgi:iron complex transport system ATP-binding protein